MKDSRAKHWIITFQRDDLQKIKSDFDIIIDYCSKNCDYAVLKLEAGEQSGTEHYQAYFSFKYKKRKSTLIKEFPTSHFEIKRGTVQQAIDYVKKEETSIGPVYEYGDIPKEQGSNDISSEILELIKDGATFDDIAMTFTSYYIRYENNLRKLYDLVKTKHFKNNWRTLEVIYVSGDTGTGKTRSIMEHYGYSNVYRTSNYKNPFDTYDGQDVIVFEEFRNSLPLSDMLNYLDGYPLLLPARYYDKQACFSKVYIISNWPYEFQYAQEPMKDYEAFDRRVHEVFTVEELKEFLNKKDL